MTKRGGKHQPLAVTSRRMKAVRQEGTRPELVVRRVLVARGIRYRLNVRSLPGSPDVANVRRRFAIFVHGCFWHRHPGCRHATFPRSNQEFWSKKFEDNVQRDRRKVQSLCELGFRVIVLWECQTRSPDFPALLARELGIEQ
ncbi:very short patch repair endonuclease [Hyalangium rubrum]|uniref:Very short patch repair endonuclease n=1 Tax=Hyalangium rubrum TaxID=3103134 RepID=A0ABU5H6D3_9BACT|nr:very short patch repair endonuclease [Hyalangium sp. s54d21]MDY7229028.1 very short patch repair endonuclease [Hyalangium sp. s54d21]